MIVRESSVTGVKFYWKPMAEMIIPTSLWQETRHSPNYIFDAVSPEDLRNFMQKSFSEEYVVDSFSCYTSCILPVHLPDPKSKITLEILTSKLSVNVKPGVVESICSFVEYVRNIKIAEKLQDYRPLTRPITVTTKSDKEIKKKKLIVRDWFLLAVWAERLKQKSNLDKNSGSSSSRQKEDIEDDVPEDQLTGVHARIRVQEINWNFFLKSGTTVKGPVLEATTANFACDINLLPHQTELKVLFKSFQIFEQVLYQLVGTDPKPKSSSESAGYNQNNTKKIPEMNIAKTAFNKYANRKGGSPINKLSITKMPFIGCSEYNQRFSLAQKPVELTEGYNACTTKRCICSITSSKDLRYTTFSITATASPKVRSFVNSIIPIEINKHSQRDRKCKFRVFPETYQAGLCTHCRI